MQQDNISTNFKAPQNAKMFSLSPQKRAAICAIMELTEEKCLAIERELNLRSGRNHGN